MENEKKNKKTNRRLNRNIAIGSIFFACSLCCSATLFSNTSVVAKAEDIGDFQLYYLDLNSNYSAGYLMDYDGDGYKYSDSSMWVTDNNGFTKQYDYVESLYYQNNVFTLTYLLQGNWTQITYQKQNVSNLLARFDSAYIYSYNSTFVKYTGQAVTPITINLGNRPAIAGYFNASSNPILNFSHNTRTYLYSGYFKSNNEYYTQIRCQLATAVGVRYVDSAGNTLINNNANTSTIMYVDYYNSFTGATKIVLNAVYHGVPGESNYVLTPYFDWTDIRYSQIELLSQTIGNDYNHTLSPNSDWYYVIQRQVYQPNISTQTGDALGDTFSLIGTTFTSLIPLLNLQIGSNITLGVLLLIPLIGIIIFAIVKLLKG
ncbi:MAG: hypothetical protein MJ191_06870 [Clostridium sp.]|nr:hypothetical protein [Clostridium sp.]